MTKNVLLCGVGGQGTVLASRLIALAAMEKVWRPGVRKPSEWPSGAEAWLAMCASAGKSTLR